MAEIDAGLPADDEYETLDPRAVEAARWTDRVVRQLIDEIRARGGRGADGRWTITFGKLFDETANVFDALAGICKTAKKYGVLGYDRDQLWQGQDDAVVITLLKEEHGGIVINRRKKNMLGRGAAPKTRGFGAVDLGANPKCFVCAKTVYAQEKVVAGGRAFHKACFRCADCNRVLKPSDFCNVNDKFYCEPCYKKLVSAAGGAGKEYAAAPAAGTPEGRMGSRRSSLV